MYTFNADRITSYELGSEEPTNLAAKNDNLFTASADSILSRMGKVFRILKTNVDDSWSYYVFHCMRGLESWRRQHRGSPMELTEDEEGERGVLPFHEEMNYILVQVQNV